MTICYTQTTEDYIALLRFHRKHSATMPWSEWLKASLLGIFAALQASAFFYHVTSWYWTVLLCLGCGISIIATYFCASVMGRRFGAASLVRSACKSSRCLTGDTELEVTLEGILLRRNNQKIIRAWDSIGKITADGDYTFIAIKAATYLIIPHSRLQPSSYVLFMQKLAQR